MKPSFDASLNTASANQAYDAVHLAKRLAANMDTKKMKSSADHCIEQAEKFLSEGRVGFAHEWSCASLEYSVGILDKRYQELLNQRRAY